MRRPAAQWQSGRGRKARVGAACIVGLDAEDLPGPLPPNGLLLAFTRLRSRSAIADHLHTDAVTPITVTTPSPGFSGFASWG